MLDFIRNQAMDAFGRSIILEVSLLICELALNKYIEKSPNIFFIFGSEIVLKNQTRIKSMNS